MGKGSVGAPPKEPWCDKKYWFYCYLDFRHIDFKPNPTFRIPLKWFLKYISAVYLLKNPRSNKINIFCQIRVLGGCAHTTFAHPKIFGALDFLKFNFKMRLRPQKWSHGLWNPEILSHVKYGPNLTIKRPLKRILKYISAVCLHFYL